MTINEMKNRKQELGLSNEKLSELTGVPIPTIQKIFSGTTKNPRSSTIQALEKVLSSVTYSTSVPASATLKESTADYPSMPQKQQGEYTIEDYYAWPEDQRIELIDGVIYDMTAPIPVHQLIAGEVYHQITEFIQKNGGECIPFISPIDVQLDRDARTMIQPDVIIVCDPEILTAKNIYGAPDFVLEVISPSTRRKDFLTKLRKYEEAGVKEYWIVDPYKKTIFVYYFENDALCPGLYPLDADVPINIYHGELIINLRRIENWLKRFSEQE